MQRSLLTTKKEVTRRENPSVCFLSSISFLLRRGILLLFCSVMFFGCGPREEPRLFIYCNETFWYVMQEQAIYFSEVYGSQVILIPLRASRTPAAEETIEITTDRSTPLPWRPRESEPTSPAPTSPPHPPHPSVHAELEQQIKRIETENFGDLFLSDSQKHHEQLHRLALSVKEFPVCYLTLTMLVRIDPQGNPLQVRSIKEVLKSNRTLGIVDPSVDGLGESSWNVLGKIDPEGESAIPMQLIQIYERQYDLLEALEQGKIDAALVWDSTSLASFLLMKYAETYNEENEKILREAARKKNRTEQQTILREMYEHLMETKSFAEVIPLTENPNERCVVAVRMVVLGTTTHVGHCERFADFIRSEQGKSIFKRFGFVPE